MSSSSSNLQSFYVVYLLFLFHYGSINTHYKSIIYVLRKVEFAICASNAYTLCAAQNRFYTKQKKFTKFYFGSEGVQKPFSYQCSKIFDMFCFWYFQAKLVQLSPKLLQESKELVEETKRAKWAFKLTNAEATRAYKLSLRRV